MTQREHQSHITDSLLVRAMDDELSSLEAAQVESHLSHCDDCKRRQQDLRAVSDRIDALAHAITLHSSVDGREVLVRELERRPSKLTAPSPGKVLRRFGWGMAIAATLALGVIFAPGRVHTLTAISSVNSAGRASETFEVNGETFVALPYSNPDLPVSTSHIVQMQVPVSSLAEVGVAFEPVSAHSTALDHSVVADILVGMDGQPLGVHVLSPE